MGSHVLREQEQDESHAIDINSDLFEQLRRRRGPQVRGVEFRLVIGHAVTRRERRKMRRHHQDDVRCDDGEQTEGGNGNQNAGVSQRKESYDGSFRRHKMMHTMVMKM